LCGRGFDYFYYVNTKQIVIYYLQAQTERVSNERKELSCQAQGNGKEAVVGDNEKRKPSGLSDYSGEYPVAIE
jgi:hypothetical protein